MHIEKLKTVLATGERHLGDLCFWALETASIERNDVEHLWASAGRSIDLLPDPPSQEKTIKLAIRDAQAGQKERLIRLAREDQDDITFGIVHEHSDGLGYLAYTEEAKVSLDRLSKMETIFEKRGVAIAGSAIV